MTNIIDENILLVFKERELNGLEILDELNLNRPSPLRLSSLYPALNRLERQELIEWRWGEEIDEAGGARPKYYKLTERGSLTLD